MRHITSPVSLAVGIMRQIRMQNCYMSKYRAGLRVDRVFRVNEEWLNEMRCISKLHVEYTLVDVALHNV